MDDINSIAVAGRTFTANDINLIREMVDTCSGISRFELANTICELLNWKRSNGGLKARECKDLLETLETQGYIELPKLKAAGRRRGSSPPMQTTTAADPQVPITGTVNDIGQVELKLAVNACDRRFFRELINRHHYLGYKTPFGARLCYLIVTSDPSPTILGAMQFSSPAWRLAARDNWIGWGDDARRRNLQQVVNQSRFLLFPWVKIKNLASKVLSIAAQSLGRDWMAEYGVKPLLIESMVDVSRYSGSCYRAANWYEVGVTSGRGRMDRHHQRHGQAVKAVFVYPLGKNAVRYLCGG